MAHSRDWDELQWIWLEWRRRSGAQMKDLYRQLVQLNNDAARLNSKINYLPISRLYLKAYKMRLFCRFYGCS